MSQKRKQHYRTAYCDVCSRPFKSARFHARHCSNACRQKSYREGRKDAVKIEHPVTLMQLEMLALKYGS